MKKSTLIGIIVLALLGAYAIYLATKNTSVSKLKPNSDFAIENTDIIDKIIIRDLNGAIATLRKKDNEWSINDKFKARPEGIEMIMKTIKKIKVQSSVSKKSIKAVIKSIASNNKKVEFYTNRDLIKTYYVGNPTQDHYGTFMLLETPDAGKSSIPYIMHLPGFNGFLSSRFHSNEGEWRFTGVFNYAPATIASIKVDFLKDKENSYMIKQAANTFTVFDVNKEAIVNANQSLIKDYVLNYKKIHLNKILDFTKEQVDSVKALSPDYRITVIENSGEKNTLELYKMIAPKGNIDPVTGKQRLYNTSHIAAIQNDSKDVIRFQYNIVDPLLLKKSYFLP